MNAIKHIDKLISKFIDNGRFKPNILTCEETIEVIEKEQLSICRYGDGEFNMMLGRSENIKFQLSDTLLSKKLLDVFLEENPKALICIPKVFDWKDRLLMNRTGRRFWSRHLKRQSSEFYKLIESRSVYGDSRISRPYIDTLKIPFNYKRSGSIFNKIKKLWDNKKILVIEGALTRFGVGNSLLSNAKSVHRILCPPENCWFKYNQIFEAAIKYSSDIDIVLASLGPTATILASDLSKIGIWCLDIGHLDIEYEWFLARAHKKIIIDGKYINEVNGGSNVITPREDGQFTSQIVEIIT